MRRMLLGALAIACASTAAFSQTAQPDPNRFGGVPDPVSPFGVDPNKGSMAPRFGAYAEYGRNGSITRVTPEYDGGYVVYGPGGITRVTPNPDGGYTIYGNSKNADPCFFPGYGWYPCPRYRDRD
jgi:hypothetical protein